MSDEAWEEEMRQLKDMAEAVFSATKWMLEKGRLGKHLSPEGKQLVRRMIWNMMGELSVLFTTESMWEP